MKARTRTECEYDIQRRQATLKKLHYAYKQLKASNKYKDKPITVYALSKKSGVARATIHRFQEILDLLDKDKYPEIPLKTAVVDTVRIKTVDDAISLINTLTKVYNETKDKYNKALKSLSEANLRIARLETEKKELEIMINRR